MVFDGRLYTGYLERGMKAVGLHGRLAELYWRLDIPRQLYRVSRKETVTHKISGVSVSFPVTEYWQYQRFRWMHPELPLFQELVETLSAGDVFWDVGAHLGWHAVVAASIDPEISVEAFEPHPETAEKLREVIAASGHNVSVHQLAVSDEIGTASFTAAPDPAAHLSTALDRTPTETISVETTTGDKLVADGEAAPPDVLKIDAEGADAAVLRGLKETIATHQPRRIYCEVHVDRDEITTLLDAAGYTYEPLASSRPLLVATPAE